MTAVQVVLDQGSFWALIGLAVLASVIALVAALAAWRSAKASKDAVGALETARREMVVTESEWQDRSPVPRRAEDAARLRAEAAAVAPRAPRPPAPVRPAPVQRTADTLIDPDRPGQPLGSAAAPRNPAPANPTPRPAHPAPPPPTPISEPPASPPEALLTEPLSPPRGTSLGVIGVPATSPPTAPPPTAPPQAAPFSELPPREEASVAPSAERPAVGSVTDAPSGTPLEPQRPVDPAAARLRRLEDPDPFVRIEAIEGLRGNPKLVDALLRALHDEYPVVRRQAVRALKETGGPEATRALLEVAKEDTSAEVREEAVSALGAMLGDSRRAPEDGPIEDGNNGSASA